MDETVTISKEEYERLLKNSFELRCLNDGGVDNWEWHGDSLEPFYKKYYPENFEPEDDE